MRAPINPKQLSTAQTHYQQLVIKRAKRQYHEDAKRLGTFDPQGRWLTDVELTDEDYKALTPGRGRFIHAKTHLVEHLGFGRNSSQFSNLTRCSIDCRDNKKNTCNMRAGFATWLNLPTMNEKDILDRYWRSERRTSITPLQEELEAHQSLLLRVLKQHLKDDYKKVANDIDNIFRSVRVNFRRSLNRHLGNIFSQALVEEYNQFISNSEKNNDDNSDLDVEYINKKLDKARVELTQNLHYDVIRDISLELKQKIETFDLTGLKSSFENLKNETFEATTATGAHYLRTDARQQSVTWISATEKTAHDKKQGKEHHATRVIRRSYRDNLKSDYTMEDDRVVVRAPSLAVLKLKDDDDAIEDVRDKFTDIQQKYFHHHPNQPIVYNLLTSLQALELDSNKQNRSAEIILKAAHRFNREKINKLENSEDFIWVQNIAVNQHTRGPNAVMKVFGDNMPILNGEIYREARLMSDIALLHTLNRLRLIPPPQETVTSPLHGSDPAAITSQYNEIIAQYKQYLKSHEGDSYFHTSVQGIAVIEKIKSLKSELQTSDLGSAENDGILTKDDLARALLQLYASDYHVEPQYGMLIQALSVCLQKLTITGCKSANERFTGVMTRDEYLCALLKKSRDQYSKKDETFVNTVKALAYPEVGEQTKRMSLSLRNKATHMQQALDKAIDYHSYHNACMAVSHEDQAAGPKGESDSWSYASGKIINFNTNYYETKEIAVLQNKQTKKLQVHNVKHEKKIKHSLNLISHKDLLGSELTKRHDELFDKTKKTGICDEPNLMIASQPLKDRIHQSRVSLNEMERSTIKVDDEKFSQLYQDLFRLINDQQIKYDDEIGIKSFFVKTDHGLTYLRDARAMGSFENMSEVHHKRLYQRFFKSRDQGHRSRQWLIMGVNYTLALANLYRLQFKDDDDKTTKITRRIKSLADEFIKHAEEKFCDPNVDWKDYFDSYVNVTLLNEYKLLFADKEDDKSIIKKLDSVKDWMAMHSPTFKSVTINQIKGHGFVGEALTNGAAVQWEQPVCRLTPEQVELWQKDIYKQSTWYQAIDPISQKLCDYFHPKLSTLESVVVPSQLRDRIGIGGKNSYHLENLLLDNGRWKNIFQQGHSGGLPVILPVSDIKSIEQSVSESKTSNQPKTVSEIDAKNCQQMKETARENLQQRIDNVKQLYPSSDEENQIQTQTCILNSEYAAWKWNGGNMVDLTISKYSKEAASYHKHGYYRPAVALGRFESTDFRPMYDVYQEGRKLITSLNEQKNAPGFPINQDQLDQFEKSIKIIKTHLNNLARFMNNLGWKKLPCYDLSRYPTGVDWPAFKTNHFCQRNAILTCLRDPKNSEKFQNIGYQYPYVYTNVSCASGDNRTQDAVIQSKVRAIESYMDQKTTDSKFTRRALTRNIQRGYASDGASILTTGANNGASQGLGGIRKQSINAFPIRACSWQEAAWVFVSNPLSSLFKQSVKDEAIKGCLVTAEADVKNAYKKIDNLKTNDHTNKLLNNVKKDADNVAPLVESDFHPQTEKEGDKITKFKIQANGQVGRTLDHALKHTDLKNNKLVIDSDKCEHIWAMVYACLSKGIDVTDKNSHVQWRDYKKALTQSSSYYTAQLNSLVKQGMFNKYSDPAHNACRKMRETLQSQQVRRQ